jgi:hypothetical protein
VARPDTFVPTPGMVTAFDERQLAVLVQPAPERRPGFGAGDT